MPKGKKPDFIARAKQDPDNDMMVSIGAAWKWKEGDGFVVRLQMTPTKWDGSFILVPPKEE